MKKIRLKDVADKTGVSISTVSRILSCDRTRKMKDETVDLVLKTAEEMGYFSTKRKILRNAMGVVHVAVIFMAADESISSPFFSGIIDGVRAQIRSLSDSMSLSLEVLTVQDKNYDDRLLSGEIDAAILLGRAGRGVISEIKRSIPNLIYAGLNGIGGLDEVICDGKEGIKEAVCYLGGLGHRSIAYVGLVIPKEEGVNEYRYIGYREGLLNAGLAFDSNLVENTFLTTEAAYEATGHLLERTRPTAIVAANDNVAIGVLKYLKERNIRVPEEMSVIGFDNIEVASMINPSLTTFDVPKRDLGRFSVTFLLDRMENPRKRNIRITIPYELVIRESTGEAKG